MRQAIEIANVNLRKQALTNQYPVGDDVSKHQPDAVGSAALGMTAAGHRATGYYHASDSPLTASLWADAAGAKMPPREKRV